MTFGENCVTILRLEQITRQEIKVKKNRLYTALSGLIVGGTMLVPGVSGGSMAMILGVYNKLVTSVSSFFKHMKESIIFLAIFAVSAGVGMILFANPLGKLLEMFPRPMGFFFIGAVAGGIPLIYKESQVTSIKLKHILYVIGGLGIVVLLSFLPEDMFGSHDGIIGFLILVLAGFVAAVALILPGISVSYMFLVLGMYEDLMNAVSSLDVLYLLPMAIGLGLGIILTTRILENMMKKFPHATYMVILGFLLGSLKEAFPGVPVGWEWPICILTFAAGFAAIFALTYFSSKREEKEQTEI